MKHNVVFLEHKLKDTRMIHANVLYFTQELILNKQQVDEVYEVAKRRKAVLFTLNSGNC